MALQCRGFHTGPVIDLTRSEQYDITSSRVVEWLCHLLWEKRLRSIVLEPPCTTFSPAAHPSVRSYSCTLGFDRSHPKTLAGNSTAFACFTLFLVAVRCRVPALLEQPRLSKMRWLSIWRWILRIPGVSENWLASCAYGAPYRKEFALLGHLLQLELIHRKCPGRHVHVRIEGRITKESAIYHPRVAAAFARVIALAITAPPVCDSLPKPGLESVLCNDLLLRT